MRVVALIAVTMIGCATVPPPVTTAATPEPERGISFESPSGDHYTGEPQRWESACAIQGASVQMEVVRGRAWFRMSGTMTEEGNLTNGTVLVRGVGTGVRFEQSTRACVVTMGRLPRGRSLTEEYAGRVSCVPTGGMEAMDFEYRVQCPADGP